MYETGETIKIGYFKPFYHYEVIQDESSSSKIDHYWHQYLYDDHHYFEFSGKVYKSLEVLEESNEE
jgi:hypothetical protein